jgi:hypothetical protein
VNREATPERGGLIASLARRVLRPIIGILIRNGLHYQEFAAISRNLYVEVAGDEFGISGRRTNTSRIAMLTGLSRPQAKRELDLIDGIDSGEDNDELEHVRHASRLLLGWHTDRHFVDSDGRPLPLPVDGQSPDFTDLYERYSGKVVPLTSMLKELISVGAVEELPDGRVVARARSFIPQPIDPTALFRVGLAISDLATTASHNLYSGGRKRLRFERFATNQLVPARDVPAFQDFLAAEGQAFLERADDWLSSREQSDADDTVRIGVGVYQILTPPIRSKK